MTGLGRLLMVLGSLVGSLWWIVGVVAFWNNAEGLFKLAGFFVIPDLIAPFVIDGMNGAGYYGLLGVSLALFWGGALLVGDDEEEMSYR